MTVTRPAIQIIVHLVSSKAEVQLAQAAYEQAYASAARSRPADCVATLAAFEAIERSRR